MDNIAEALEKVVADLTGVLDGEVRAEALSAASDVSKMELLRAAGEAQRRLDALIVETVASADSRSAISGETTFCSRFGCRNVNELLQRTLRVDNAGATRVIRAASAVERGLSFSSGEPLPALWPQLREALLDGVIGVSGLLAAITPIMQAGRRISAADRERADAQLAAFARGTAADLDSEAGADDAAEQAPPATPDDLRMLAQVIVAYLDPDGAEPADEHAMRNRNLTLGRLKDGVIPIRGGLLPEVAAQLQRLIDAYLSPKSAGPPEAGGVQFRPSEDPVGENAANAATADEEIAPDDATDERSADEFMTEEGCVPDFRTSAQKRHDAFAAMLGIAARHEDAPTLGGAAPTLVVSVTADDYAAGTGWAQISGVECPVPISVAAHTACAGGVQRVLFDGFGRIVGIGVTDRIFTAYQRRAIAARDKECIIPGCHVRADWCEFHHVREHAIGGPTHTDNGVPVCWFHHRSLDKSGWEIRMVNGRPQVRGPSWWDPARRWRSPTVPVDIVQRT